MQQEDGDHHGVFPVSGSGSGTHPAQLRQLASAASSATRQAHPAGAMALVTPVLRTSAPAATPEAAGTT